jgi:hypothetical protein
MMRPQLSDSLPDSLPARTDVVVEHHGTLLCLRLRTRAAREWMRQHVPPPDYMESPWSLYCSLELGSAILQGMASSGLALDVAHGAWSQRAAA